MRIIEVLTQTIKTGEASQVKTEGPEGFLDMKEMRRSPGYHDVRPEMELDAKAQDD